MAEDMNMVETPQNEAGEGTPPLGQQAEDSAFQSQGNASGNNPMDDNASGNNPMDVSPSESEDNDDEDMPIFKEKATQEDKLDVYRWYFDHGYNNRKFIMGKLKLSPYEFDRLYRILSNHDKQYYEVDDSDASVRKAKITDTGVTISKNNIKLLGAEGIFVKGKEVVFMFDKKSGNIIASVYKEAV